MIEYKIKSKEYREVFGKHIHNFIDNISSSKKLNNIDPKTVASFGEEWTKFNHFDEEEIDLAKDIYFDIVSEDMCNKDSIVMDMGCGTGRWTKYVCKKVKFVEAVDPSDAVLSAAKLLENEENVRITQAQVSELPFPDGAFDFIFSLGVLHHIPDTKMAMKQTVAKLKSGGYFLVYLYYALDNRSFLFKLLFHLSNVIRMVVCRLPSGLKKVVCDILAIIFYLPSVFFSKGIRALFGKKAIKNIPLSFYHDKSWNVIRNDALDRFGTPLEQRFSKAEIKMMMEHAGLTDIIFSDVKPYWHAVGRKK